MSGTVVSLLTPPGTGAIATVEVCGPRAWEVANQLFTPAGKPLPASPEVTRFWFGTLGSDEVILAVTSPDTIEVHCHGGRRVVRWVIEQFRARGCVERNPRPSGESFDLLQRAPTLRTASILLDQLNGAFANEVGRILTLLGTDPVSANEPLGRLAELGRTVGRHLVEPWKVVVAGPPNVGKSSLVNALAGYQRTVVSAVAGTTRDAVGVRVAFDGWPVELIDTAGLRETDGLEAEGIKQARRELDEAHLVLWVMDGTAPQMVRPDEAVPITKLLTVVNKSDAMIGWGPDPSAGDVWGLLLVSAVTGAGMSGLLEEIVIRLVPRSPAPNAALPFTPHFISLVEAADSAVSAGRPDDAARMLREALALAESDHVAGAAFDS